MAAAAPDLKKRLEAVQEFTSGFALVYEYHPAGAGCYRDTGEAISPQALEAFRTADATLKGLQTAAYLKDIASKHGVMGPYETGLVINRAGEGVEALVQKACEMGMDVLGVIPPDENVAAYDRVGRPTIELPDDSPSVVAVRGILKGLRRAR